MVANPNSNVNSSSIPVSLESSASLLEAIVHSSDDAIITKDLDGLVTSWNRAATDIFGYLPEEMIGKSILQIIPTRLHHEEPEILRRLRAGEQISHHETVRQRKDGREITVSLAISPVRNRQGEIIAVSKIARDITEQRLLSEARFRLAAIVESADVAIISKDLNGVITSWNQAAEKIFGYSAAETVGVSILLLIPQELYGDEDIILKRIRRGDRIEHFETIRLTKSGERIHVSLTISPIKDFSGNVIGASKILRDVTGSKKLERSLIQAEKLAASGRMAATIAHEINNPLESILNLIYLARANSLNSEAAQFLATAEEEILRLSHIAKQTLGFYRDQNAATSILMPELIGDALKIYDSKLKSTGIQVQTHFAECREVTARRGEMMQVISNLISNAFQAMASGGTLTITVEDSSLRGEPALLLSIADSGSGIPRENLRKVFEPFFTTRDAIGTGIGLWIAKQFVEGHAGTIELESSTDPASHGTKATILLPYETRRTHGAESLADYSSSIQLSTAG